MLRTRIADGAEVVARQALPVLLGSPHRGRRQGRSPGSRRGRRRGPARLPRRGRARGADPPSSRPRVAHAASFATLSVGRSPPLAGSIGIPGGARRRPPLVGRPRRGRSAPGWPTTPASPASALQVLLGALSLPGPGRLGGGPRSCGPPRPARPRCGAAGRRRRTSACSSASCRSRAWSASCCSASCCSSRTPPSCRCCSARSASVRRRRTARTGDCRRRPKAGRRRTVPSRDPAAPARRRAMAAAGLAVVAAGHRRRGRRGPDRRGPSRCPRPARPPAATSPPPAARRPVEVVRPTTCASTPAPSQVPAGDRLVIELTNTDDRHSHDLALETGHADRPARARASRARLDVGVVGRDLDGWCSHRRPPADGHGARRSRSTGAAPVAAPSASPGPATAWPHAGHARDGGRAERRRRDGPHGRPGPGVHRRTTPALPPLQPAPGPRR